MIRCYFCEDEETSLAVPALHDNVQDTSCEAWYLLENAVEKAKKEGALTFRPLSSIPPELASDIVTLPASIGTLKDVRHLQLYGSRLSYLPSEIGQMTNLRKFTPYTSYRLHWFPYEITRCAQLSRSTVSTRAIYGNMKYRTPFPDLNQQNNQLRWHSPSACSVCECSFHDGQIFRRWISLRVATDVLPLLVHACSEDCIAALPSPPSDYVDAPHCGGAQVKQPDRGW